MKSINLKLNTSFILTEALTANPYFSVPSTVSHHFAVLVKTSKMKYLSRPCVLLFHTRCTEPTLSSTDDGVTGSPLNAVYSL